MAKQIGIDLGTANTLFYVKNKGIVLREPSVVAIDKAHRKVVAVGDEAKRMLGKTPDNIQAKKPLKDGVIADFDVTAQMLRMFFQKINATGFMAGPSAVVCVPYGVTEVERHAVEDATYVAGAKKVAIVEEPIAAAVGSGLRITGPRGSMIVDIGGGTTEVAVLSLGGIVISQSLRVAGAKMDEAVVAYMKEKYQVSVGDATAEMLKRTIGSAHKSMDRGATEVRGRNLHSGLPAVLTVTSADVREAIQGPVNDIIRAILQVLENTPPELSADIFDYGIMLAGGGALLPGLASLISEKAGVRVTLAKKPLDSVCLGLGRIINGDIPEDMLRYTER